MQPTVRVSITPKGYRVGELRRNGLEFNEALAIADREYSADGEHLTPIGEAAAQMEVHA